MAHVVGHKGQVVIAKEIRARLGIQPGWLALQRLSEGGLTPWQGGKEICAP